MIKFFHVAAISALVASAGYAYSIKYDTLYQAEQVTKLRAQVQKERDAIAILRAEWAHLNRPDRLQPAVESHLDLRSMSVKQLARMSDLPNRPPREDEIGRKLEALGLAEPTATPKDRADAAHPPSTQTPKR